jgi:hypothetical protein
MKDSMMAAAGPGFCPRCGTARMADLPFCPRCGLNLAEIDGAGASAAPGGSIEPLPSREPPTEAPTKPVEAVRDRIPAARGLAVPPAVLIVGIVVVGLLALGLLRLPQLGGSPTPPLQASAGPSGGPAAPIVGLSILSPTDGQAVATKDVLVIGLAPPGLGITQDVSFGLDQHTTADGTGHWAIKVGLNEGDNVLKFRIGDDHSTEKTVRVIYTKPG